VRVYPRFRPGDYNGVEPGLQGALHLLALRRVFFDELSPGRASSGSTWKLSAAQGGSVGNEDSRERLGQAAATNLRRNVSASGAVSLAATVSPRARNSAVQLAPIGLAPISATRRMLSLPSIPFRVSD